MVKIMLSADLAIGMMLSLLLSIRSDEDFVAWQELRKTAKRISNYERDWDEILRDFFSH